MSQVSSATAAIGDFALPPLREDLSLSEGAPSPSGGPCWLLFDPVGNRYFQFDIDGYQILSLWSKAKTASDLKGLVENHFGAMTDSQAIAQLTRVLEQSSLLVEPSDGWQWFSRRAELGRHGWLMWLVHNYLFIRVPLLRPQPILDRIAPYVSVFYTRTWIVMIGLISASGLYLVSRQWPAFVSTFQHFFSLDGLLWYAAAISFVKVFHELGHACTAVRFGCRVPTMGIAFLVMMPMLYTDVTDAWQLKERRRKLLIDAGGIIAELMLAGVALFLWAFLPDGPARSAAFVISTTSLFASLAINLSPLMKFDGYFILSDWLGLPNLQSRANALGRWQLRKILFGLDEPCPDKLPKSLQTGVITYAWVIWVYRLVVFTGIALAVYHMFFKVLGIMLFLVEIIWFVLGPIVSELKQWWLRREPILRSPRSLVPAAGLGIMLALVVVPWSGRIAVPAVLEPAQLTRLYGGTPGQLEAILVTEGALIEKGQILFRLASPRLKSKLVQVDVKMALAKLRNDRRMADAKDKADTLTIEQELASLERQKSGLLREFADLEIKAPFSGRVVELPPELAIGRWVGKDEELAVIASEDRFIARGFVTQNDLGRIYIGATGTFSFEDARQRPHSVSVVSVAFSGSPSIDIPELASPFGGPIAVEEDKEHRLIPTDGAFAVTLSTDVGSGGLPRITRGLVHLDGTRESFLAAAWRQVLKVLVRESGA